MPGVRQGSQHPISQVSRQAEIVDITGPAVIGNMSAQNSNLLKLNWTLLLRAEQQTCNSVLETVWCTWQTKPFSIDKTISVERVVYWCWVLPRSLIPRRNGMGIFFTHSEATWFRVHGLFSVRGSVGVEPRILILSPVVTARMGLQRSEKMYQWI